MFAFKVPDIGEGVVEAEVLSWRVAEGDVVTEDQILVELLTDKAEIEIPSPCAGRVQRIHFEVGETAQVGDVLIEIDDAAGADARAPQALPSPAGAERAESPPASAEAVPEAPAAVPVSAPATASAGAGEPEARAAAESPRDRHRPPTPPARPRSRVQSRSEESPPPPRAGAAGGVQAVPAVRELAKRLGVDLRQVRGTGPRGRIMRRDVERYTQEPHEAGPEGRAPAGERSRPSADLPLREDPPDWTREPLRGLRRAIAERMSRSRRTAAHFTYVEELDLTSLLERAASSGAAQVSPLAWIARAAVRALAEFPILNASIDDERGEIVLKGRVHLGIAAATEQGLLVPVVRDAIDLNVTGLAERIAQLAEGARTSSLRPTDLRGSTFTITSLGKLGGVISTPILNPPEVAILGVNAIRKLPRVIDDRVAIRRVMNLSLSVDHRIADGLVAAEFIQAMRRILESADFDELRD